MTHLQIGGFHRHLLGRFESRGAATVLVLLVVVVSMAKAAPPVASPQKAQQAPPEPMLVPLQTRDGVLLKATFYPGTKGKKSVPVVILHEWKGNRGDYKNLALYLQSKGHAVMVPDLRGHGDSTKMQRGQERPITLSSHKTKKKDLEMMVREDMEAVKRFLREQNNAEELNIEKLCIIGVEMGAVVAANWAYDDWSWPELPTYKQGQDVKALVLISPEITIKGMSMSHAIDEAKLQGNLSVMLMVGAKDKKALDAAEKIENKVARYHPEAADGDAKQKKTLYVIKLDTTLQGAKLVNQPELKSDHIISRFIDLRLVEQSLPWSERRKP